MKGSSWDCTSYELASWLVFVILLFRGNLKNCPIRGKKEPQNKQDISLKHQITLRGTPSIDGIDDIELNEIERKREREKGRKK